MTQDTGNRCHIRFQFDLHFLSVDDVPSPQEQVMFWTKKTPLNNLSPERKTALTSNFNDFEIGQLVKLGTMVSLTAGSTLALEGAFGREVVVIVKGTAAVTRDSEHVATVGAGDIVGEMAVLSGERRNATVVAETAVDAYVLSSQEFRSLLSNCPRLESRVAATAEQRLATV